MCHHHQVSRVAEDVRSDIMRLVGTPLEADEFGQEVSGAARAVLPFDGWCLLGLDPTTGLRTFQFSRRGLESTADLAANEMIMPDVNRYADLARCPTPAGWLSRKHPFATRSFRLNEILRPQGYRSELRLALRDRGRLWGALVLFRENPTRLFDDTDAAAISQLAGPLARAARCHPVRPLARRPEPLGPGVVLMSRDNRIISTSEQAWYWLDDLVPGGEDETTSSDVTRVLFDAANAVRLGVPAGSSACIRTVSGRWLRIEGTRLGEGEADVAVLMQPAGVRHLVPVVAAHNGLTCREAEILAMTVEGLASKQMARRLTISILTVNEHLKSIYRKCGVSGREELFGSLT